MNQKIGKQSVKFGEAPHILEVSSVVGKKEGEGPLKSYFDIIEEDPFFGKETWEEAESKLQAKTVQHLLDKSKLTSEQIDYIFSGDLLGQSIASSFGLMDFFIPFFGLYGACSTMGEGMSLAAMTVAGDYAQHVIALASSHFASAEKTFRYPLDYGSQRPFSATWTVTGCGAVLLGKKGGFARITGITTGKINDYGLKDSQNMGACMAPAAADTLLNHFRDFGSVPHDYDKIITGDLGVIGQKILIDLLMDKGIDISTVHMDCGIEMFDAQSQDTHAGASGCGCSAATFCGYISKQLRKKVWKKILFIPTGALLSLTSFNEGQSVPGIAHCVCIEAC
ncbi:MAG: stage V sporulation protein AD [Lachnospiraceae bacterium]|nr:stage V sporulation protein AD [Lachnospiraceae bacterium]